MGGSRKAITNDFVPLSRHLAPGCGWFVNKYTCRKYLWLRDPDSIRLYVH